MARAVGYPCIFWDLEFGAWNLELGIWSLEFGAWNFNNNDTIYPIFSLNLKF